MRRLIPARAWGPIPCSVGYVDSWCRCVKGLAGRRLNNNASFPSEPKESRSMAKILLVDDSAPILAIMALLLEQEGHVTTLAADGGQALKLVANDAFDLIITDLVMPGKEGIETILALRKSFPAIKVIAMSGGGSLFDSRLMLTVAEKLGACRILEKPFTKEGLIRAVNSALKVE